MNDKDREAAIREFIGVRAMKDDMAGYIWGVNAETELQMIAEVRGWGAIQNRFATKDGIDFEQAMKFQDHLGRWIADAITEKLERVDAGYSAAQPVPMLLYCPKCFEQHVDEAKPDVCQDCGHNEYCHVDCRPGESVLCRGGAILGPCNCKMFNAWLNPPHKSHRCGNCNHVWRPADVPTEGVRQLETTGERDGSANPKVNQETATEGV